MSDLVLGIDLGTTNTCAAIFFNKKNKILENKEGGRITASCVFFTEQNSVIVGPYAKRMSESKPEYGVTEIKRLIGRKFDDPYVKKNLNYLPFKVKNISNEPVIVIETNSQIIKKTPVDLCTYILDKVKKDAEAKMNQSINLAVITVPAYFSVTQREATLMAASKAGFTVLKLLNEPTAAALSYYFENVDDPSDEGFYSLVYDLGGGTFDVAILLKKNDNIEIVGVDGDTHLGGHDLDNLIIDHVCDYLVKTFNYDPRNDRRSLRRLSNECEDAKKYLSTMDSTNIVLNGLVPNSDSVMIPLTRSQFEQMADKFFKETIEVVDRCLKKVKVSKDSIKEVILSGGSSRIPKIQTMVSNFFGGKDLNKFVNPDECVAEGAALQAAMLSQSPQQNINEIQIVDVVPLSLGISNFVDEMTFLIKRNSRLPATGLARRITVYDRQTNMAFEIYEGERLDATKNYFLGHLEITNLTPAPPGECAVTVTMNLDTNGILTVKATEVVSNRTKDLKIAYTRGHKSDSEVSACVVDARENQSEDEKFKKFCDIKGYVIKYCVRSIYNFDNLNLTHQYREMYDRCNEISSQVKRLTADDIKAVQAYKTEIVNKVGPIVRKHNFFNMP